MSKSASNTKTAEFARLFDLFERLASRKTRIPTSSGTTTPTTDVPVPADLAPVLHSLASIAATRSHLNRQPGSRRYRTVSATDDEGKDDSIANFPMGKQFPFTFKMMLHKLYALEEWARKVKEVVETSQMKFKPLAEQEQEVEMEKKPVEEEEPVGKIRFQAGPATPGRKAVPSPRPRSHSVVGVIKARESRAIPALVASSPKRGADDRADIRAVKKRCVGRRKSTTGLATPETGRIGGGWVYDAEISSVERKVPRAPLSIIGNNNTNPESSKYPALGRLESGGERLYAAHRRVVSQGANSAKWQWGMAQMVDGAGEPMIMGKRSHNAEDASSRMEEACYKRMKRPHAE